MLDLSDPYCQQFIDAIASILVMASQQQQQQQRETRPEDVAPEPLPQPDFVVASA